MMCPQEMIKYWQKYFVIYKANKAMPTKTRACRMIDLSWVYIFWVR
jgi:hypothetical protein